MLIRHDIVADAKYITLLPEKAKKGVVARTKKVHPWLLVDYDKEGNIFGIEILKASANSIVDVFEELFGDPHFGAEQRPSSVQSGGKSRKSVKVK